MPATSSPCGDAKSVAGMACSYTHGTRRKRRRMDPEGFNDVKPDDSRCQIFALGIREQVVTPA